MQKAALRVQLAGLRQAARTVLPWYKQFQGLTLVAEKRAAAWDHEKLGLTEPAKFGKFGGDLTE